MPGVGKGRGAAARNNLKGHALEGIAHSSCIGTWRQAEHFIGRRRRGIRDAHAKDSSNVTRHVKHNRGCRCRSSPCESINRAWSLLHYGGPFNSNRRHRC